MIPRPELKSNFIPEIVKMIRAEAAAIPEIIPSGLTLFFQLTRSVPLVEGNQPKCSIVYAKAKLITKEIKIRRNDERSSRVTTTGEFELPPKTDETFVASTGFDR